MLGAILVPFMGAVGSIAEGRPLMAGSTLRSLFEGDCSGFETGSRTLEWLYTVCGTAFRAVSDYCRMRARRHARNSKGYGVLPLLKAFAKSKFTCILFHLAALCDSLRCGAYGTYCYGIS